MFLRIVISLIFLVSAGADTWYAGFTDEEGLRVVHINERERRIETTLLEQHMGMVIAETDLQHVEVMIMTTDGNITMSRVLYTEPGYYQHAVEDVEKASIYKAKTEDESLVKMMVAYVRSYRNTNSKMPRAVYTKTIDGCVAVSMGE